MATCDMGFEHTEAVPAEPEVIPVPVEAGPNENDVRIAEIEAEARIETEKIWTEQQALALAADNEALRGEIKGIRETLATLAPPEPEPAPPAAPPVVIADPPPGEAVPPPPETQTKSTKKAAGYWSGYDKS